MCSVNAKVFLFSNSQFFPPTTLGRVPQISVIFKSSEFTWLCNGSAHLWSHVYAHVLLEGEGKTSLGFQVLKHFNLTTNRLNIFGFLSSLKWKKIRLK